MSTQQLNAGGSDAETDDDDEIHEFHADAPDGFRWGERTLQTRDDPPGYWYSDAYEMRRHFGLSPFDLEAFTDIDPNCIVYPDIIRHRLNPDKTPTEGGTATLIRGAKNYGKTTYRKNLVPRILGNSTERIVDRGRPADSGWLELRWWTTLWLPENASVEAEWVYEMDGDDSRETVEDLSDVVREVRYYSDVFDLVDQLGQTKPCTYHVVYPDPSFAGCEEVMRVSQRTGERLPFIPAWEADTDESPTPLSQWWFAFVVAQLEHGHFNDAFMSLFADEAHEVFPPNPANDDHKTDRKLDLMQSVLNSARKRMLSWYLFTQDLSKIDYRVHMEVQTWVFLADGRPNPVSGRSSTYPPQCDAVPMDQEFLSKKSKGQGLCFVENENSGFAQFKWPDLTRGAHPDDENRWLQITLGEPETQVRTSGSAATTDEPAELEFDETFFEHHEQTGQLYVRSPGEGIIDLSENRIVDELVAPADEHLESLCSLEFRDELRRSDDGNHWEVVGEVGIEDDHGGVRIQERVFVRLPISDREVGE